MKHYNYQFTGRYFTPYLNYNILCILHVPTSHDYCGSPFGQFLYRLFTNARIRPCHEKHLALQIASTPTSSPSAFPTLAEQADEQNHRQNKVTPRRYHIDDLTLKHEREIAPRECRARRL